MTFARRLLLITLAVTTLAASVAPAPLAGAADAPGLDDPFPAFSLPRFEGGTFDLSSVLGKKTVVVAFVVSAPGHLEQVWARDILEGLEILYPIYQPRSVEFVAVLTSGTQSDKATLVDGLDLNYVVLQDDETSSIWWRFGRQCLFIVGPDGKVDYAGRWEPGFGLNTVWRYLNPLTGYSGDNHNVGSHMPSVTLADSAGNPVVFAPGRGRATVFVYWYWGYSYWNPDFTFMNLLYAIDLLDEEYAALGVDFVVVHTGDYHQRAAAWLSRQGFSFPTLWDSIRFFERTHQQVPVLVGVDAGGTVRFVRERLGGKNAAGILGALRDDLAKIITGPPPVNTSGIPASLPAVGRRVGEFALPDFEGKTFYSSALAGRPVCHLFWDSECNLAQSTLLRLLELYPEFRRRGMEFVVIDPGDESAEKAWLSANPLPFTVLRDPFSLVLARWGVVGIPTMVVTDANGVVTFSGAGDDIHEADLVEVLEQAVGPGGGPPGVSDPLRDQAPLEEITGDFSGLRAYVDPLLEDDKAAALSQGLSRSLEGLHAALSLDETVLSEADVTITFYRDFLRFLADSGGDCSNVGLVVFTPGSRPVVRIHVLWYLDQATTLEVMRHELVHALVRLGAGTDPPPWFDEGLAQALSLTRWPEYAVLTWLLMDPDRPGPADVDRDIKGSDVPKRTTAYEVAYAAVYYLIHTYGGSAPTAVVEALGEAGSLDQAFQAALGVSVGQFWEDFWLDVPEAQRRVPRPEWTDPFPDVSWRSVGAREIRGLAELGVISGFPDGTFRPEDPLTRAQFAKIAVLTLAIPQEPELPSGWLDAGQVPTWSLPYMGACLRRGIIRGSGGHIRPGDTITRAEAVIMIIRALGLDPPQEGELEFDDASAIPSWAAAYVVEAACQGIIECGPGVRFDPTAPVTRREVSIWLSRALTVAESMTVLFLTNQLGAAP